MSTIEIAYEWHTGRLCSIQRPFSGVRTMAKLDLRETPQLKKHGSRNLRKKKGGKHFMHSFEIIAKRRRSAKLRERAIRGALSG